MTLGQRIKVRRKSLLLTQQQIADAIGISTQHISAIELDQRAPSLPFLTKLAEELGVTIDYLVTGKESVVTDTIPAIQSDKTLHPEAKRAMIALVRELRHLS
jgi:transcriptional regulator with XRE-family HTH domain